MEWFKRLIGQIAEREAKRKQAVALIRKKYQDRIEHLRDGQPVQPGTETAKPKRRRRTPEEREASELLKQSRSYSLSEQRQQVSAGITHYIWQTAGDERTCPACAANDGKRFSWKNPPRTGHPGYHQCDGEGHCRCVAIADL